MDAVWQWVVVKWLGGVATLFCVLVLLLTWFNVAVLPECQFTSNRIGYFSVFGMLSFTFSAGANTYLRMTSGYANENDLNHWIPGIIYSSTWALGQSFVYLLFIERLKYAFKGTKYQPTPRYYIKFYVLIGLFLIDSFVFHVISALKHLGILDGNGYMIQHSGEVRDIGQQVIDMILSIGLLYAFNRKLFVLQRDVSKYTSSTSMNMRQNAIIHIAARLTVISSFAIISTQILMIYTTVIMEYCIYVDGGAAGAESCGEKEYLYFKPIADACWCSCCFINCLCIFLSYDFVSAQDAYYSICSLCDTQCIKCCGCIATRSMMGNPKQISSDSLKQPMLTGKDTTSSLLVGGPADQVDGGKVNGHYVDSTVDYAAFEPETELSSQVVSSLHKPAHSALDI